MIKKAFWSDTIKSRLYNAVGDYICNVEKNIINETEFIYYVGGAVVLLRPEGKELVIVGFDGVHMLSSAAPIIYNRAREMGFNSIRIHTKRKAELKFLNKLGLPFFISEYRLNKKEYVMRAFL